MRETPGAPFVVGTTRGLPDAEAYDHFCDGIAEVYVGVRPTRPATGGFAADFSLTHVGALDLGVISTPGVSARRDRRSISRVADDALFVNHSAKPWGLAQAGRTWSVAAGSAAVLDNAVPFDVFADPRRRLDLVSLRIPRDVLPATARRALPALDDRLTATGYGVQLGAQVGLLAQAVRTGMPQVATAMTTTVIEMLDAVSRPDLAPTSPTRADAFRAYARTRLRDPSFGIGALARAFGCTTRTVQAAFAREGEAFSVWLRAERLDLARSELSRPAAASRSIAAIARETGFGDTGTFHRAYRARFGRSPGADR
ncbi:helix-turn-helix domain-containing protein [Microbacterium sp. NPDC089189]|uniref:helix-turn-helix domain-containing protein n=1 Tax=Microbacterium sp. NPDC089189 TaxID=3154972 RepID=UPI00343EA63B